MPTASSPVRQAPVRQAPTGLARAKRRRRSQVAARRRSLLARVETLEDRALLAPIPITLFNSPLTENFNTLATTGSTNTLLPAGWLFNESGGSANTSYSAGTGSSATADTYSFGASGNSDRAFGSLQEALTPIIGASYINNTGAVISGLTIAYTGEQWRLGATGRTDRLDFQYSLIATQLHIGIYEDFDTLDFNGPISTGTVGALDGNLPPNRTALSQTIPNLNIANGATFFIRWNSSDASGADDGLGIDDFSLTALPVNTPPTISDIANQSTRSYTPTGPIAFTVGDAQTAATALTITAVSSNQAVVPDSNITFGGSGAARTINVVPIAATGTATITVTVTDAGGLTAVDTYIVTVNPAPTLSIPQNLTANAGGTVQVPVLLNSNGNLPQFLEGIDLAIEYDTNVLQYVSGAPGTISSAPGWTILPAEIAPGRISAGVSTSTLSSAALNGSIILLNFNVLPGAPNGITRINLRDQMPGAGANPTITTAINEGGIPLGPPPTNSNTDPVSDGIITIGGGVANNPPTLDQPAIVNIHENSGLTVVNLTGITTGGEPGQSLVVSVTNNTPSVLGAPTVSYLSPSATGSFSFSPVTFGTGTFTVTVRDSGLDGTPGNADDGIITRTVTVNVAQVNSPPSFTKGSDVTVLEDSAPGTIANWATSISAGPPDEVAQTLTFNVSNNNNPMFAVQPAISSSGTLTYTLAPNANGTAIVTVTLQDNGGTASGGIDTSPQQTFNINVTPVNDIPSFTAGANQTVGFNAGPQTVNGWASAISTGPSNESSQTVTFNIVTNSNPGLFAAGPAISSNGTLTYTPATNVSGSATITINVQDNGGTANGGVDITANQTFTITVNPAPVNNPPTLDAISNITGLLEDVGLQTVPLTGITAGGESQMLGVSATSGTPGVIPNPTIVYASPNATGTLTFTPVPNTSGTVTITVTVRDAGLNGTLGDGDDGFFSRNFDVTITPVNDAPTFNLSSGPTVLEDSGPATINNFATSILPGPADEVSQAVAFTITNNTNAGLFSVQPTISPLGTLTFTPAANANGSATISVRLDDNGGTANGGVDQSTVQTFTINVTAVNDAPSFTIPASHTSNEDAGPQTVANFASALSAGPTDEAGQALSFNMISNNNAALFLSQPTIASNGTLTYTAQPNASGTATIIVSLSDNGGLANGGANTSATQQFTITVNTVNDVPVFTAGGNETVFEDAGPQSVSNWATGISAGAPNESSQTLTFQITGNTNAGLFAPGGAPAVNSAGLLTYTPAANANGSATITLRLVDNGGTANGGVDTSGTQSFTITVVPVNDAPSFVAGANQSVLEDAGPQTVAGWATSISTGPTDESGQAVAFSIVSNSNAALFSSQPSIAPNGTLTYTPAANANGLATIVIRLTDDGGTIGGGVNQSATQSFTISVTAVNDAPSFTIGANQVVPFNSPAQTVNNFATNISAGPTNEAGQAVAFTIVGNTNGGLFSVAPAISPTGTLTYTPAFNVSGSSTITVQLGDDGGTANGGSNTSGTQSFTITVSPAPTNNPPTLDAINNITINEDAGLQTVNLAGITAGGESQTLQVTVLSTNTAVVPTPAVSYTSPSTTGSLSFTPPANVSGSSTVTVTVRDHGVDGIMGNGDDGLFSRSFTVTVNPVNDVPSFTIGSNQTVLEDSGAQSVSGFITVFSPGPVDEVTQTIMFNVTNVSNPGLFAVAPAITSTGLLTYTPAAHAFGLATISVTISDNGGIANGGVDTSAVQTFTINVTGVNDAPSFTIGANQTIPYNSSTQTINNWATSISPGPGESGQSVFFNVTGNTNVGLFSSLPTISSTGTLQYTPAPGVSGTASITIELGDNGGTANGGVNVSAPQVFTITVSPAPVNNLPTINGISNITINEDAGLQNVGLSGITTGGEVETLTITASSSNPTLIPTPTISYTSPAATGSLSFAPATNLSGTSTITVTVRDPGLDTIPGNADDGITTTMFTVTVNAVNDAPSFTIGANQSVLEDAGPQTVNPWATAISTGPTDEASQTVSFTITANSNPSLFSAGPSISSTGVLTYTPAPDANGLATITVQISDNGGTANGGVDTSATQTFTINVTPVNDAPGFGKGADQTVLEDAGPQTVSGWATAISAGPANESGQTLSFSISGNTNPGLFSVAPAVSSTGVLTYTPAPNAHGTATITLNIADNGGTSNGGVATSASQTFIINVTSVNDVPSFTAGPTQNILEDAGPQTVAGWATGISAGPTDEAGQTVTFAITANSNPSLFSAAPTVSSAGTLTYTPAPNANGSATITLQISDSGGTANGGVDTSATQTFTINVASVNDVPSFTLGGNQTVNFNSPAQTVPGFASALSTGPSDEAGQTLSFNIVSNSNPALFAVNPAISPTGTLTYTPAAGISGSSTITVNLMDSGGTANGGVNTSPTQTFTITVSAAPVNNPPTINPIANVIINEDAGLQTVNLSGITAGGETQTLSVTATSSNPTLIPTPAISYTSPNATGTLTYTPTANLSGSANITVTVRDAGLDGNLGNADDGIVTTSFSVTVNPVNDAPSFTLTPSHTIPFNSGSQIVPNFATGMSAGPADEAGQTFAFNIVSNSNSALFITQPALAPNGTLTYVPATGVSGTATITVNLQDNGGTANGGADTSANQTFTITISPAPINSPPTINTISNLTIPEDAGVQTVALAGITAGGESQALAISATSSNPALIANPTVIYTSPNATGNLFLSSALNASGSSTITVMVRDAGFDGTLNNADDGVTTTTFTVTVTPVNDGPDATDLTLSTAINTPVNGTLPANDPDGPSLTFTLTSTPALGTISGFNPSTGAFTYTPNAGASGIDTFGFSVSDGSISDAAQVRINIQPLTPVVAPGGGNLTVTGTPGQDTVIISPAGAGQVRVRAQVAGGPITYGIYPLTGSLTINTGDSNDYIVISGVNVASTIDAGAGDDYVSVGAGSDFIVGGPGADSINAGDGNNVIWGDDVGQQDLPDGGNDVLSSLGGNDVMYGGGGHDQLYPGAGNDYAYGGQGNDLVSAGVGNDRIYGGFGDDTLVGDEGNDVISGGGGNDSLLGRTGNDVLIGGTGADSVNGEDGDDLIIAMDTNNSASSTVNDANDVALMALIAQWNATHAAGIASGIILADDGEVDSLTGGTGDDDFYRNLTDVLNDYNTPGMGTDRRFP